MTAEKKNSETVSDQTGPDAGSRLGLVDVLDALGRDLASARDRFADDPSQKSHYGLGVTEAVIELSVAVMRETGNKGSAGIKWHVLELGGERTSKDDDSRIQRITLTLKPVETEGNAVGAAAAAAAKPRPSLRPVVGPAPLVARRGPGKAKKK